MSFGQVINAEAQISYFVSLTPWLSGAFGIFVSQPPQLSTAFAKVTAGLYSF